MIEKEGLRFLNAPLLNMEDSIAYKFCVMGIPTERGYVYRGGTSRGPESVRKTSLMYYYQNFDGLYDPEKDRYIIEGNPICDIGDITDDPITTFNARIKETVANIRKNNSIPITIGGDHSITYPIIQGVDQQIDIIHLDAHSDYQQYDEEDTADCGLVMRRVNELPQVRRIIHAGLRGYLNSGRGIRDSQRRGNIVIPCNVLKKRGAESITEHIGDVPVYISFDSDVLDPSICPGTTVPEPGGINYALAKDILTKVSQKANVVGADFVELCPPHDSGNLGSFHLTKLIIDLIGELNAH